MKNKCMFESPAVSRSTTITTTKNTSRVAAILCTLCLGAVAAYGRSQSFPNTDYSGDWLAFGYSNALVDGDETTATYGETFIAPALGASNEVSVLNEWTFYLRQIPRNSGGLETAQNFEFFVMEWDGNKPTGSILYESGRLTVAANDNTYEPFTARPNLDLVPGKEYVIFINVSLQGNDNNVRGSSLEMAGNGTGDVFDTPTAPSPLNGQFVYQYTQGEFSTSAKLAAYLTTYDWATWAVDEYAVYDATFTGVP